MSVFSSCISSHLEQERVDRERQTSSFRAACDSKGSQHLRYARSIAVAFAIDYAITRVLFPRFCTTHRQPRPRGVPLEQRVTEAPQARRASRAGSASCVLKKRSLNAQQQKKGGKTKSGFFPLFFSQAKKKNALSLSLRFFLPDENETEI